MDSVAFWNVATMVLTVAACTGVVVFMFKRERGLIHRLFADQQHRVDNESRQANENMRLQVEKDMSLISEKLDGHLRLLVMTDGKAKESIAALNGAIARIDTIDVRLNALEHRMAFIERSQESTLEAARRLDRREGN